MAYITKLSCGVRGIKVEECPLPAQWQHTLIFGGVQMLMSQLPNLERCVFKGGQDGGRTTARSRTDARRRRREQEGACGPFSCRRRVPR